MFRREGHVALKEETLYTLRTQVNESICLIVDTKKHVHRKTNQFIHLIFLGQEKVRL